MGSKWGDLLIWNTEKDDFERVMGGIGNVNQSTRLKSISLNTRTSLQGPGGSVQNLKFDETRPTRLYTCSIDGTFAAKDFGEGVRENDDSSANHTFLDTEDCISHWYTAFDCCFSGEIRGERICFWNTLWLRYRQDPVGRR